VSRIKEIRKLRQITQQELAEKLGITQSGVQKLESGRNDLTTKMMRKLADALEVEPWELLPKDMQPNISLEEQEVLRTIRKVKSSN
jgi:transcriptional regulator with XRE-family HTH domain